MAKYRKISPQIWNDAKFRSLSDSAKLVFFMLLTHPQTSSIGTLRAFTQGLAAEMRWEHKAFMKAFGEALSKGMVKADERCGLIWMPNFMRHNVPESPNVLRSWRGALDDCPECKLKIEAFQAIKVFSQAMSEGFQKAFNEAFRLPSPNQEQKQDIPPYPPLQGEAVSGDESSSTRPPAKKKAAARKTVEKNEKPARGNNGLVHMTDEECWKVAAEFEKTLPGRGHELTLKAIELLDTWFAENPNKAARSKDHLGSMRKWVIERVIESEARMARAQHDLKRFMEGLRQRREGWRPA